MKVKLDGAFALERPMKGYYKGQPKGIFELEERFSKEDKTK